MYVQHITPSCVGCPTGLSVFSVELVGYSIKFRTIGTDLQDPATLLF